MNPSEGFCRECRPFAPLPFFLPPNFTCRPNAAFRQHDTRRRKLRFFRSGVLERRQAPSRLQRLHRVHLQHRHRLPRFLARRPHRLRHRRRGGPLLHWPKLLLDRFRRRNHLPLGLLRSRMRQDYRPLLTHLLYSNTLNTDIVLS